MRRKAKGLAIINWIMAVLLLLALGKVVSTFASQKINEGKGREVKVTTQGTSAKEENVESEDERQSQLKINNLKSKNSILLRLADGQVLYGKKAEEKIFPASLTKMMTALVAIEAIEDLSTRIWINPRTLDRLFSEGASIAGFERNDEVPALDLLYGVMLPSGAEASVALAEHIAGSEAEFVTLMNQKSQELGLTNTHFTNTTGLHEEDQYSTVSDLSQLLLYALENQTFKEIFTTKEYATGSINSQPGGMTLESSVFSRLGKGYQLKNGQIIGGKTGYTPEAGLCLASIAEINGEEYILVTANAQTKSSLENYHMDDAKKIYNGIKN